MEVTETLSDGLKREFQVQVPAADLEARVTERLGELKDRVQLRGFRPGKVPVTHLRKIYGKAVMAETIEAIIRELNAKIVSERGLKLAMEPKVTIPNEATAVEQVIEALDRIAEQNRPFAAKAQEAKVEKGDRVVIDFAGKIDGAPFEGGSGGDVGVNVGSGTFIPGFEDQLVGMSAGETRLVQVTFPANYASAQLASKPAEFDVTVKSVEAPAAVTVDDAFAKSLGLESLDKLKAAVKARLQQELAGLSRQRLKRQLLDKLDEMHKFALPPTLAEDEFKNVWAAVEGDLK